MLDGHGMEAGCGVAEGAMVGAGDPRLSAEGSQLCQKGFTSQGVEVSRNVIEQDDGHHPPLTRQDAGIGQDDGQQQGLLFPRRA